MSTIGSLHGRYVHQRRVQVLASHLTALLPWDASVLDVGCGDGRLAAELARTRPDLDITGVDTVRRPETLIPVTEFDGLKLPLADRAVDVALFVDVVDI
jgi:SAM-dependent methyltransferase